MFVRAVLFLEIFADLTISVGGTDADWRERAKPIAASVQIPV